MSGDTKTMLSVVIPAYNEETRIAPTIEALAGFFGGLGLEYELVVADDGSTDGTASVVAPYVKGGPKGARVRHLPLEHGGKGSALKAGVAAAKGDPVFFVDADLPYGLDAFKAALDILGGGSSDLVIGARDLPGSSYRDDYPWYRHLAGKTFSLVIQALMFRGIPDTQCGFKGFRKDVAGRLFSMLTVKDYAFDVELLFLAKKLGYSISRIPVRLVHFHGSKVRVLSDSARMLKDLLIIRWNDLLGRYGR